MLEFIILVMILCLVLVLAFGIKIVNQQHAAIVETLGQFSRVLQPGFNFIFFPFQQIAHVQELRINEVTCSVSVKTSDNQIVSLPVSIMLKVNPGAVEKAYYELKDPENQLSTWVLNAVRSAASDMTIAALYEDKDTIRNAVQTQLEQNLRAYGYILEDILIEQPTVSAEVERSFNRVIAATREAEAAKQEAEAIKIRTVAQAQAEAEAQKARAEGIAESRKIIARGMAESLDILQGANQAQAMDILLATNKLDALREIGKHGNLMVVDLQNQGTNLTLPVPVSK